MVNALTQDRRTGSPFASFRKAVLPTPKIRDVISEPDMGWMKTNVVAENFFQTIDMIHFKTGISLGLT